MAKLITQARSAGNRRTWFAMGFLMVGLLILTVGLSISQMAQAQSSEPHPKISDGSSICLSFELPNFLNWLFGGPIPPIWGSCL